MLYSVGSSEIKALAKIQSHCLRSAAANTLCLVRCSGIRVTRELATFSGRWYCSIFTGSIYSYRTRYVALGPDP